jgi:hypothetical protein
MNPPIAAAEFPSFANIEVWVVDRLRPWFTTWKAMAARLGISVAKLLRIRRRGNIPDLLGKNANPNPPPFSVESFLNGLGI